MTSHSIHAPPGYDCPFCRIARGKEIEGPWVKHTDIVYRDSTRSAFISPHFWPNNPGHVVIIPHDHYKNLYAMPDGLLGQVAALSREVALALKKAYGCDGTSVRQHNEPAGNQDVWHYHLHLYPRYSGDSLYGTFPRVTTPEQRAPYAARVRAALQGNE